FLGVCGGLAADGVILEFFKRSDLIVGLGFEPVESDKLWHHTMKLVSIGPVSIAAGAYRPHTEAVGDVPQALDDLRSRDFGPYDWSEAELRQFRADLEKVLKPEAAL